MATERNPPLATLTPRNLLVYHRNGGRHSLELLASQKGWILEKMENERGLERNTRNIIVGNLQKGDGDKENCN